MLRVCNICLNQVAKVDEEDEEDDRRSVVSGMTSSFPGPGVHHLAPDSLTRRLGYQPNSPFSASQLFGRGDEPFTLFSIAEAKRALSGGSDGSSPFNSRAGSPDGDLGEDHFGITIRGPAVPFRRGLAADNDKDASGAILVPGSDGAKSDNSHIGSANQKQMAMSPLLKTSIEFPKTISIATEGLSSVQFPVTSPDQPYAFDTPTTGAYSRSRYSSLADMEVPTPFIRSRVQSRLMDGTTVGEPGWRTRRESTA
jgi:1-phosphatidylinositol-3-phosphate 5-kinase